jgi:hypothetical protein
MTRVVRTERYRRGVFGWLMKLVFIAFNLLMAAWTASIWYFALKTSPELTSPGMGLGVFAGSVLILVIWACGAVVLGLATYFSRGRKVIVEERREPPRFT